MVLCLYKEVLKMKKLFSIVISAAIIAASLFSINAFAADQPKTDALLDKLDSATEFSVTLKAGETKLFGFLPADVTNTFAVKGNNICYEYASGAVKARLVTADEDIYGFFPTLPFFYVKTTNPLKGADVWEMVKKAANLTQGVLQYVKSYNETLDGTEYYVEEYNDREFVTSKFYYIGDELKVLKVEDTSTNSIQYTYFENISFTVDDSVFAVPSAAIDATPILKGLFLALIAA